MRSVVALLASLSLLAAACGDGDGTQQVDADGPSTTTTTTVEVQDTIPVEEVRVPSRSGGIGGLLGAEESEPPLADGSIAPCDEELDNCDGGGDIPIDEDGIDDTPEVDEPIEGSEARLDYIPEPEHRRYCTTMADIEDREVPDFESAEGLQVIVGWFDELAATTDGPQREAIVRMRDNLVVLLSVLNDIDLQELDLADLEAFEEIDFDRITREFEQDAETMESFTGFACFGEGSFAPPDDPELVMFCDSFEAFTDLLFFTEDPAATVELIANWFDDTESFVPEEIKADFDLFHRWVDDNRLEFDPEQLEAAFDSAPQDVQDAGNRFGEWSDEHCDV